MPPSHDLSIGIDFGTSNTVVAIADPNGRVEALTFAHGGEDLKVYVTALCFWDERHGNGLRTHVEGGPWAIDQFLEGLHAHRFIQSFKTFAASATFKETRIFRERYGFEDLLSAFLRTLMRHGGARLDWGARNVVVGRPVQFAGYNPDDALAMQRYRAAFGRLGAEHAHYVYEPVGAAFFYARQLDHDSTVLVADFGGGTSDFSVMRFSKAGGVLRAEPLGHAGIGIAGRRFRLSGSSTRSSRPASARAGSTAPWTRSCRSRTIITPISRAGTSSRMMKGSGDLKELRELARTALDPEPLEKFIDIIEYDLGFALYRAVSSAKVALSSQDETDFRFQGEGVDIRAEDRPRRFRGLDRRGCGRIADTVDEALSKAGVETGRDRAGLPHRRHVLRSCHPAPVRGPLRRDRLTSADQFESIAYGLALIGQTEAPERWAVTN